MYTLLFIAVVIFVIWTQINVISVLNKYKRVKNSSGLNGVDLVKWFNKQYGWGVKIRVQNSYLGDFYDPIRNYINLTSDVAAKPSLTSLAVAAHELGHAMQRHENFILMRLRSFIARYGTFSTYLGYIFIMLGVGLQMYNLALLGLVLFSFIVVFSLVTLPLELDASRRAILMLEKYKLITAEERPIIREILTAAALTYVAALAVALLDFLRFLALVSRAKKRN